MTGENVVVLSDCRFSLLQVMKIALYLKEFGGIFIVKKGFVEAHVDDGLLEIFGLKQGWHASFVMVELISAKHIAQASKDDPLQLPFSRSSTSSQFRQAAAIRLEIRGGEWKQAYMQMDGEPWKQPINNEFSTFVEIKRVPFQSPMISGE
uniref:Diacylglycerol kinase accessory domain-containing protein n=1 Tax=Vitis vinifera TaxID=29760 RepID=A5BBD0_VITVI|nr:hypothetical protein VITISV_037866 [Vitis vinifera]